MKHILSAAIAAIFIIATPMTAAQRIDDNKISVMGSSVANGEGADCHHGYAWMYGKLLGKRYAEGLSDTPFHMSGIAVNGDNTPKLLARYDDLTNDAARYVVFGVSLGNEGIHGTTRPDSVAAQFRDNMLRLIERARHDGKIPVVMNNYTRGDFTTGDYTAVRAMNLLIHEWDVPSVNLLGAIDNGQGRWADGYQNGNDIYHPSADGHRELFHAIVPSLFDALRAGKPQPMRSPGGCFTIDAGKVLKFNPDATVHPFTIVLCMADRQQPGHVASFPTDSGCGNLDITADGRVVYTAPDGNTASAKLNSGCAHTIAITHYHAQGVSYLYADGQMSAPLRERISPDAFAIGGDEPVGIAELFFYRSAMNSDELDALRAGRMLKSSLDLYLPSGTAAEPLHNAAQSMLEAYITTETPQN